MIAAAPKYQWLALGVVIEFQHFAHEDSMIAAIIGIKLAAFRKWQARLAKSGSRFQIS